MIIWEISGKKPVTIEVCFTYIGKIRIPLAKPELLTDTEKPALSFIVRWLSSNLKRRKFPARC